MAGETKQEIFSRFTINQCLRANNVSYAHSMDFKQIGLINNRYKLTQLLYQGKYGQVIEGFDERRKQNVAIKICFGNDMLNEILIYQELQNKNVMINTYYIERNFYSKYHVIVMDLYKTDLLKLYKKIGHPFCKNTIYRLGYNMLCVVDQLHGTGYVHYDAKLRNWLIDENNNLQLIDYGFAKKSRSFKTDLIHIGMCLFYLFCGENLYFDEIHSDLDECKQIIADSVNDKECRMVFTKYFDYVWKLKRRDDKQNIDYKYLKQIFNENANGTIQYEWQQIKSNL